MHTFVLERWRHLYHSKMTTDDYTILRPIPNIYHSMTQLLTHTIAHSTRSSFSPKNNNQPTKKLLILTVSWVKVVENAKILTFKVNFLCQKYPNLSKKLSLKNIILGAFLKTSIFEVLFSILRSYNAMSLSPEFGNFVRDMKMTGQWPKLY